MMFDRNTSQTQKFVIGTSLPLPRSLSLLSASLVISLAAGCASVDKPASRWDEGASAPKTEVLETKESPVETAQTEKESAKENTATADEMMASLKAPVEEPTSTQKAEPDAEPEMKVAAKTVKTVEVKVAEKAAVETTVNKAKEKTKLPSAIKKKASVAKAAEKQVKASTKSLSAKPLSISEKDLPATYDIWVLRQGDTPLTQGLVISTPTWEMGKEGYMSQIWLTLKENEIHINSSSDIATEVKNLGLRIDGGELIPFTRIAENNIAIVEGEWLDKLAGANQLDIFLGFFPDKKPTSDTFQSDTSLENLDRVVATYRKLSK